MMDDTSLTLERMARRERCVLLTKEALAGVTPETRARKAGREAIDRLLDITKGLPKLDRECVCRIAAERTGYLYETLDELTNPVAAIRNQPGFDVDEQ